jgi:hypothetical protein
VRGRPRYVVQAILEQDDKAMPSSAQSSAKG